jgi:hypothetical protein
MKIYNITKGQLITVFIFGTIIWIISLIRLSFNTHPHSPPVEVWLLLTIPFALIFYILGWKNRNK